jgi:hypothetical protein
MFKDYLGRELRVGDQVVRAYRLHNSAYLETRTVARIENGKLYLNDSHVSLQRLDTLLRI